MKLNNKYTYILFLLSCLPTFYLSYWVYVYFSGNIWALGPDPGKWIVDYLGEWALKFLLITLSVSTINRQTGISFVPQRRMLGLFCAFYATLHFLGYFFFLLGGQANSLLADLTFRPYIIVGGIAIVGLWALAITSNHWAQRRLKRRWKSLHRSIYIIAVLVIAHYIWLTKGDYQEPIVYAIITILLLGERVWHFTKKA